MIDSQSSIIIHSNTEEHMYDKRHKTATAQLSLKNNNSFSQTY